MERVTFAEYENAKAEIIKGVHYRESSTLEGDVIHKTYATEENGNFYEVDNAGRIEFWSDKHPESRVYDEAAERAESAAANGSENVSPEKAPSYGQLLHDKIRTETKDFNALNEFEKFILDRGYLYHTEEELKAGYDRALPLYEVLSRLNREEKLKPGDVFQYAAYCWCLRNPEAVIAYNEGRKWLVNNCGTEISEERARVEVCEEWGFEASRVRIIGTPYYDATDWQFIRFDCAHMTWLWKNGNLYQVYAD